MTDSPTATRIAVRDDHNCFGCGADNPWGLHLIFFAEPDGAVYSHWTPELNHQGYDGMVHGGIISTVFDEVMAWAIDQCRHLGGDRATQHHLSQTGRDRRSHHRAGRDQPMSPAERPKSRPRFAANQTGSCSPKPPRVFIRVPKRQSAAWQRNTPARKRVRSPESGEENQSECVDELSPLRSFSDSGLRTPDLYSGSAPFWFEQVCPCRLHHQVQHLQELADVALVQQEEREPGFLGDGNRPDRRWSIPR